MNRIIYRQNPLKPRATEGKRAPVKFLATFLMLFTLPFLVAGCPTSSGMEQDRADVLKQYEALIRWSEWDGAVSFLAPDYVEEHPISQLEMDRLRMFKVTNYTPRAFAMYDDGFTAIQTVEIKMYNSTQAIERTIIDEQLWRYDPELKHWLLYSGLPDPTKRQ